VGVGLDHADYNARLVVFDTSVPVVYTNSPSCPHNMNSSKSIISDMRVLVELFQAPFVFLLFQQDAPTFV
jgi:hypothetical protein